MRKTNPNPSVLDHDNFKLFLDTVPNIDAYTASHQKPPLTKHELQLFIKLNYYCALRVTESLNLRKKDFDLKNHELTVLTIKKNVKTTIPTILINELSEYLKSKTRDEKLFKTSRQLIWKYFKEAGKLAKLSLFKSMKKRQVEGVSTTLLRDSFRYFMQIQGADDGLISLKMRNISDSTYLQRSLNELKKWEKDNIIEKYYGIVVFLDALGTKGSWKNNNPNELFKKWEFLTDEIELYLNDENKENEIFFSIKTFSDTIIITAREANIEKLLSETGMTIVSLLFRGISLGFYMRGCISAGYFFESEKMLLGPAVDEAARYYELFDWIGVSLTPSAYSIVSRSNKKSTLNELFIKYDIPTKNGLKRNQMALLYFPEDEIDFKDLGQTENISILDFIHDQLEHSTDVEGNEKWKNTLDFLKYVDEQTS